MSNSDGYVAVCVGMVQVFQSWVSNVHQIWNLVSMTSYHLVFWIDDLYEHTMCLISLSFKKMKLTNTVKIIINIPGNGYIKCILMNVFRVLS